MSVYQTKPFLRFARKARLSDGDLLAAAEAVASGAWDADLGGGVFKQRIAREGRGKSGGFRVIIVFRAVRTSSWSTGSRRRTGRTSARMN